MKSVLLSVLVVKMVWAGASKQNCCRELEVSSNAMAIAGNFQVRCKDVKRK